jgi:malonate-semialdehyde dehydrogenase (acetylating)/methylmalonate-semialdehyde dehydrogenase
LFYVVLIKATNEVISNVPKTTQAEMKAAVDSASKAFESWSQSSILSRQQILFAYQGLVKSNLVML